MKKLILALLILSSSLTLGAQVQNNDQAASQPPLMPLRTIVIKDPAADDRQTYFNNLTHLNFWLYKAGSANDVKKVVDALRKNKGVKDCGEGQSAGDFKEIGITLAEKKNKAFFVSLFKSAGLTHIKINAAEPVSLDKL